VGPKQAVVASGGCYARPGGGGDVLDGVGGLMDHATVMVTGWPSGLLVMSQ
jgi:hypothetical protein